MVSMNMARTSDSTLRLGSMETMVCMLARISWLAGRRPSTTLVKYVCICRRRSVRPRKLCTLCRICVGEGRAHHTMHTRA